MAQRPLRAAIVGAGHRALTYASYSKGHPDELRIVAVADPNPVRRRQVAEEYSLPPSHCFADAAALAKSRPDADAIINGTMDHHHVDTTVPLLEAGYDVLLEKPFAVSEEEMWRLADAVKRSGRKVMICHVLRYAPFYAAIRERVAAGAIGDIQSVQTIEHVSYHHMATAFVRGKWNRLGQCRSPMLLAKCCHDLDLIAWMKSGIAPRAVSSFGSLSFFNRAHAPAGSGTRCLVDCPIEPDCVYSARKMYLDHPDRWRWYVWEELEHLPNPTAEDRLASLRGSNPHGRCVWKCDNDVVDHQCVAIQFEDGATVTHNMVGGTAAPQRAIHLVGTVGEIQGVLEENRFVIRYPDPRPGHEYNEEVVSLEVVGDMHGAFGDHAGGDMRLVADFVQFLRGGTPSISCTSLGDSINGHLMAFCADRAMRERRVVSAHSSRSRLPDGGGGRSSNAVSGDCRAHTAAE